MLKADSSIEIIFDGVVESLMTYEGCHDQDVLPGSRGEISLTLLRNLLDANSTVTKYDDSSILYTAYNFVRGELGFSVLSLFLTKNDAAVKVVYDGCLLILLAAFHSCLDVMKFAP